MFARVQLGLSVSSASSDGDSTCSICFERMSEGDMVCPLGTHSQTAQRSKQARIHICTHVDTDRHTHTHTHTHTHQVAHIHSTLTAPSSGSLASFVRGNQVCCVRMSASSQVEMHFSHRMLGAFSVGRDLAVINRVMIVRA